MNLKIGHSLLKYLLPVCLVLIILNGRSYAQNVQQKQLQLRNATLELSANTLEWAKTNAVTQGAKQVLVHAYHILTTAEKHQLRENGVEIEGYIAGYSYTAVCYLPLQLNSQTTELLYGINDVKPEWKLDERLNSTIKQASREIQITVVFSEAVNQQFADSLVNACKGVLLASPLKSLQIYSIAINTKNVQKLASNYGVISVAEQLEDEALNNEARAASKSSIALQAAVYGGHELSGQGVTIGIGDNVSGNCHIDLKDRIINYNPVAYTNHGVHINGIAAGAGIIDAGRQGVAPKVKIINQLYSNIWQNTPVYFPLYNMTLTNNSYAAVIKDCAFAGTYNAISEAIDKLALQYNTVLHVFAAGNDGNIICPPFPQGYATVVGGYQPAKNNLVVTSTDKSYVNATDASRGPIKDGRLKPELTAVGVDVRSTTKVEEYLTAGGTSMASPGVAGGLALLTERYKQLHANANPRADVLKTLILNSAMDIGTPGPDYTYGFGFMNLYRALQLLDSNRYNTDSITNGQQKQYTVTVPANTAQLKLMLCWNDVAASPMAPKALVNDLDIEVKEPSNTTHLPLILNPEPSKILDEAKEGADHLNNCEQVVINNPAAGVCTITVKGFNVPSGMQPYVVAYDIVPTDVKITYPYTGAAVKAGDSAYVYWDASDDANGFTLSYSTNSGGSWNFIDTIRSKDRYYVWKVPPGIVSGLCQLKLQRNNTSQINTTGNFAINDTLHVRLDSIQCPGYINVKWNSVAGASAYEVMRKMGDDMKVVATTANTFYTISGLSLDSTYYVAVRPIIDGMKGYRSLAIKRKPVDGTCAGTISDGDLMLQKIVKPATGRKLTSTELSATEQISLEIRNLDDVAINNYNVWYKVNSGGWQLVNGTAPLPANAITTINVGSINMLTTGAYIIQVALENLSAIDPVKVNDTLVKVVRQLDNPVVNLASPQTDDFENWGVVEAIHDSTGISPNDRWDYFNQWDTCRMRSFVNSSISIGGNRSISLDAIYNFNKSNRNEFRATYNMSNYVVTNDEVRMEFDYRTHGGAKFADSNKVMVRGRDNKLWQLLRTLDFSQAGKSKILNTGSLSVTDALLSSGQTFETSTQIAIVQNDTSLISEPDFGSGITLDNVKLYTVFNDAQMVAVVSPINIECGLPGSVPLTVKVRNGVNQKLNDVKLYYQLDSGGVVQETLSSINGKETLNYTFNKQMNIAGRSRHYLNIWLSAAGDSYTKNDSLLDYTFTNQPLITAPYLETFESGNGGWYTDGDKSSWEYGVPKSTKIKSAYSGTKVWKTNLSGNYNADELSYLYSPCYDIGILYYPAIRFKKAADIENCGGSLCDWADVQYSTDRINWTKLDIKHNGQTWYDDTTYHVWTKENDTNWKEVVSPLPQGLKSVNLRFRFFSDLGAEKEGLAIDNVELFDDISLAKENNLLSISPNPTRDGKLILAWTAKDGEDIKLSISNTMGREVYEASISSTTGYNKTTIETPHFSSGVYIVNIIIGNRRFANKIVYLW